MSASALVPHSFRLTDTHIQIGEISIPFASITKYWIYSTSQIVQLSCSCARGESYRGNVALEYQSVHKAKELFAQLLAKTKYTFKAPYIQAITPNSRSVTIEFFSSLGAETFATFFAPLLFDLSEFKSSLVDRRFVLTSKGSTDQSERIRSILERLSDQVSDQMIEKRLQENNDPFFVGKDILPNDCHTSIYDFERPYEKNFEITREGLKETCWINGSKKVTLFIKPHIIDNWINQS